MADDWAKWIADAKKLETKTKSLSLDDGKDHWKALQERDKLMEAHEKALGKAAIEAYEAGVTTKKLAEFMKDKGFAAALKLLENDRKMLVAELKLLEAHCDKCRAAVHLLDDMVGAMDKVLVASKGKDKSVERVAAKKVRDGLYERFQELSEASNLRYLPDKYMTSFDGQFDKLIEHLLAQALKKGKDPVEEVELPQPLTDKKLAATVKLAEHLRKDVETCVEKKKAMKVEDAKGEALLNKAWATLEELKEVSLKYEGLARKFKKDISVSKERDDIGKQIKAIAQQYEAALQALKAEAVRIGKAV